MRQARVAAFALPGAIVFLVSCALVRGGLFDHRAYGDAVLYGHYAQQMAAGHWPYRDFFDEYPPLAQPLFFFVRLLPGSFVHGFRWTMAVCGVAALILLVAMLAQARASALRLGAAVAVAAFSPLLVGPVFLNEYDLFPAALTAGAVLAFLHRRERTTYVLLALAVTAKVYPVVLLPLALVETWEHGGRLATRRALAWFLGVLVLVHLPFAVTGPGGLRFSYWVQVRRGLEVESLGGAILLVLDRLGLHHIALRDEAPGSRDAVGRLADLVGAVSVLVLLAAVLGVALLYRRGARDKVVAAATAVTAFVAFGKVLSPQYVAWLVPLVPAAGLAASAALAVVLGLTHLEWNRFVESHGTVEHWGRVLSWWILARDLALVAVFALLLLRLRAGARSRSLP